MFEIELQLIKTYSSTVGLFGLLQNSKLGSIKFDDCSYLYEDLHFLYNSCSCSQLEFRFTRRCYLLIVQFLINNCSNRVLEKKKKALDRLKEQLMKLEVQETDREENKTIALGTSKLNYLDPRISVAW